MRSQQKFRTFGADLCILGATPQHRFYKCGYAKAKLVALVARFTVITVLNSLVQHLPREFLANWARYRYICRKYTPLSCELTLIKE